MAKKIFARDLLKTENVIIVSPNTPLSQAVAPLRSNHDAVFVLDGKKLLGVINPYYALFRSNYPPATKAKTCAIMPPKIDLNTPLSKVVKSMLQSKVYFLPVVNNKDELMGIVSIRGVFNWLIANHELLAKVDELVKFRSVTMVDKNTTLGKLRNQFKKQKISRIPVVNGNRRLVGLVTRYDMRQVLTDPQTSPRSRSRSGQKKKHLDIPVAKFMVKNVVTAGAGVELVKLIKVMIDKRIGSVVIVNRQQQPIQILTNKDVLVAMDMALGTNLQRIELTLPENFRYKTEFSQLLKKYLQTIAEKVGIKSVAVVLTEGKKPKDKAPKWYELKLNAVLKKGRFYTVARASGWRRVVEQVIKKLKGKLN